VKLQVVLPVALLVIAGCSRLETLTPGLLFQAEGKWKTRQPGLYRLVIEMSGDRVETGTFEATVRSGTVVSLRRNGLVILPGQGQDYSMEGLFRMLEQELGLAEKPALLGAPPGYSVYTMAQFDAATGRLIRYRRTVGGTSNEIEVKVLEYEPQG
jgi:hypothetical protein